MRCSLQTCLSQLAAMDFKKKEKYKKIKKKKEGKRGNKANLHMECTYLGTDNCNLGQIQDILGHMLQQNSGNLDHRNVKKQKRERERSLRINEEFF